MPEFTRSHIVGHCKDCSHWQDGFCQRGILLDQVSPDDWISMDCLETGALQVGPMFGCVHWKNSSRKSGLPSALTVQSTAEILQFLMCLQFPATKRELFQLNRLEQAWQQALRDMGCVSAEDAADLLEQQQTIEEPLIPPDHLIQEWESEWRHACPSKTLACELYRFLCFKAAQWGADQERKKPRSPSPA